VVSYIIRTSMEMNYLFSYLMNQNVLNFEVSVNLYTIPSRWLALLMKPTSVDGVR
jgi:hypothetical protein